MSGIICNEKKGNVCIHFSWGQRLPFLVKIASWVAIWAKGKSTSIAQVQRGTVTYSECSRWISFQKSGDFRAAHVFRHHFLVHDVRHTFVHNVRHTFMQNVGEDSFVLLRQILKNGVKNRTICTLKKKFFKELPYKYLPYLRNCSVRSIPIHLHLYFHPPHFLRNPFEMRG